MAFGRSVWRGARLSLLALALSCCVLAPSPGFAQSGRVSIEGIPAALQDGLKKVQREELPPATLFEAQRQAERTAQVVLAYLESEGYYQADVEPFAEDGDRPIRGVRTRHGPLFTFAGRRIEYPGPAPDEATGAKLAARLEPIATGAPARAQPVIKTAEDLLALLRAEGYPDARAEPVDALADARLQTVEVTFRLQPGLRTSLGALSFKGLGQTREDYLAALKPWKRGDMATPERLDEFRGRLAETGLFESVAARLFAEGKRQPNGLIERDVEVEIKERERRTIALGASASTSEGLGLEGEWEMRNLSGRGESIAIGAQIATLERRLQATYRRPNIKRYGRNTRLGAEIEDFETDAFDQSGANISATIEEQLTARVRGSLGAEAGYASILDQAAKDAGAGRRDLYLLNGSATAEYSGVRDVLDPQNGLRARLVLEPGLTFGDNNIAYARFIGEASIYGDLGADIVGALRGRVGAIAGPNGAPPDRLFFAGGGGSVRGYEYQSLSPREASNNLIGGRSLIEMSAELRWRASNSFGYVAFLDAGAAGSNVEPPIDQMSAGLGVGLRYYAGFGPLRVDFGMPLNKQQGDADFQIYISIGQAF